MSSFINMYIPQKQGGGSSPVRDALSSVAKNSPVGNVRATLYNNVLSPVLSNIDAAADAALAAAGLSETSVILATDTGIFIEFIDAKVDVTKQNMDFVTTTLINRSGKVKERIQADDYTVKISGNLISGRGRFPYPELALLNQILNEARSLNVASVYLYTFGITKLAFNSATFNQSSVANFNALPFTLNFVSDKNYSFSVV